MASLLPFNPFRELDRIRREMDDFFDKSFVSLPQDRESDVRPAVDVYKTDNKLLMFVDVPGLNSSDIEVTTTEDTLTIKGEFKPPKVPDNAKALMREHSYGTFARTFKLPVSINPEKVKAVYKDGILEISIPLSEQHVSHSIKINVEGEKGKKKNEEGNKNINN
jgi:HSP20 family protein